MLLILLTTFQIKVCKSIFLIHHCYEKYELIVNFVFKQLHFACISFSNILLMIFCSIQLMHIGPLIIYFYLLFTFFQMFLCVFSLYKDLFIVFSMYDSVSLLQIIVFTIFILIYLNVL